MNRQSTPLLKAALSALHYARADRLLAPYCAGRGVILTLHHVRPDPVREFDPNRILRITPEFLEEVVQLLIARGFDLVPLDAVPDRLAASRPGRPFACFTFDDGYRDNRDHAYPILKRHGVPFTVYVAAHFAEGRGNLWWLVLEEAIRRASAIRVTMNGAPRHFHAGTSRQKEAAFRTLYTWCRTVPEAEARAVVLDLAAVHGIDAKALCAEQCMSWTELREFARDPLVTIGAHTLSHTGLARLPEVEARREMAESVAQVKWRLGRPCRHFSYPYGGEDNAGPREFALAAALGLQTAVTTRKGLLDAPHAATPTALPRLSLNGDFQDIRHLEVLLSGAPFAAWNGLRRLAAYASGGSGRSIQVIKAPAGSTHSSPAST